MVSNVLLKLKTTRVKVTRSSVRYFPFLIILFSCLFLLRCRLSVAHGGLKLTTLLPLLPEG